jgi:hypothetical protein
MDTTARPADRTGTLSGEQCLELLRSHRFGRLVIEHGGLPRIAAASYVVCDDLIVAHVCGMPDLALDACHAAAAFEVDDPGVGPGSTRGEGWSVVVLGVVRDAAAVAELRGVDLGLGPSAGRSGAARTWALSIDVVSGRRWNAQDCCTELTRTTLHARGVGSTA